MTTRADVSNLGDLLELAGALVPLGLTPTEQEIVERALPDCSPGDIASGKVVPIQIVRKRLDASGASAWSASELLIGYYRKGSPVYHSEMVEILNADDLSRLAKAFRWLLDCDTERQHDETDQAPAK